MMCQYWSSCRANARREYANKNSTYDESITEKQIVIVNKLRQIIL